MLGLLADVDRRPADDRSKAARALNRLERNLREEVARLRQQLDSSVEELGLTPDAVERVVQTALELARQPALKPMTLVRQADDDLAARVFEVPALTRSWALAAADVVDPLTGEQLPVTFDHAVAAAPTTSCWPTSVIGSSRNHCDCSAPRSGRPAPMSALAGFALARLTSTSHDRMRHRRPPRERLAKLHPCNPIFPGVRRTTHRRNE